MDFKIAVLHCLSSIRIYYLVSMRNGQLAGRKFQCGNRAKPCEKKREKRERGDFLVSLVKNWEREERGIIAAWAEKMNLT